MEWISVKDKLPEEGERVIVFCSDGIVRLNRLEYGNFPLIFGGGFSKAITTHWMPLPEPPKEEY